MNSYIHISANYKKTNKSVQVNTDWTASLDPGVGMDLQAPEENQGLKVTEVNGQQ